MNKRNVVAVLLLSMCLQSAFAQEYTNDKLKIIAKKAKAEIDASQSSGYYDAGEFLGKTLCVGIDKILHKHFQRNRGQQDCP